MARRASVVEMRRLIDMWLEVERQAVERHKGETNPLLVKEKAKAEGAIEALEAVKDGLNGNMVMMRIFARDDM